MPAYRGSRRAAHATRRHLYRRLTRSAPATVDTQPNPGAAGTAQSPRAQRAIRAQKAMP